MKAPPPGLSFMDKVSMGPGDLMGCELNAIRTCMAMAASVRPKAADRCEACGDGPSKSNEALCANRCLVKGRQVAPKSHWKAQQKHLVRIWLYLLLWHPS